MSLACGDDDATGGNPSGDGGTDATTDTGGGGTDSGGGTDTGGGTDAATHVTLAEGGGTVTDAGLAVTPRCSTAERVRDLRWRREVTG
jgi:hypothetical protein